MTEQMLPKTGIAIGMTKTRRPLIVRALVWFWCALAVFGVAGVITLAVLGPPENQKLAIAKTTQTVFAAETTSDEPKVDRAVPMSPVEAPQVVASPPEAPARDPVHATPMSPGTILPPDPSLLEASTLYDGGKLPRISADGRQPMHVYAATFDVTDTRPRVAILIAGVGMNDAESIVAGTNLPKQVAFAVSPYARRPDRLLDHARATGHELLVSIPMEPQGYPLNDPGQQALLTGAPPAVNAQRLEWALTRFAGYVGGTGALGEMRGERLAAADDQMAPVLTTLAQRGLLYVDPRPNGLHPPMPIRAGSTMRGIDIILDEPPGLIEIDAALSRLEQIARERGSAIGLAGRPSPLVVDRIAVWSIGLGARGVALAPVSVVVQMPQAPFTIVRTNVSQ